MASRKKGWRWTSVLSATAALMLLSGCVMAPVEPWEIGEPVVTSGAVYYGSYPGYYYGPPAYYYPPAVSLSLYGHTSRDRGHPAWGHRRWNAQRRPQSGRRSGQRPSGGATGRRGSAWRGNGSGAGRSTAPGGWRGNPGASPRGAMQRGGHGGARGRGGMRPRPSGRR